MLKTYKNIDLSEAALFNVSEDAAKEFIDHRVLIKFPLTQGAFKRNLKHAVRCQDLGLTPDEAIEMTIDKGWRGVVYEYIKNELANRCEAGNGGNRLSREDRDAEAFREFVSPRGIPH